MGAGTLEVLKKYYRFIKQKPCVVCGRYGGVLNHADHVKAWSPKLRDIGGRSHKGDAAWFCVPLCPECHAKRHTMREADFYEQNGWPLHKLYAYIAHNVLTFFLERAGE